jgi:glutathione synthase/RimK-type ligase-like ATP-grasp enzyme
MSEVQLATCADLPDGDEDGAALVASLSDHGIRATWVVWDDPGVDWAAAPVVLRSTWDYTLRREQFLAWARQVPRLANPADVVSWNSDKIYLRELADEAIPTVPTRWASPQEALRLPTEGEFVLKPSVGAGSRGAGRFSAEDAVAAQAHARDLYAGGRTVLVQPYLEAIDTAGETALIYLGGAFSHAIAKAPLLPQGTRHDLASRALYVEETITAREPSDAELAVGADVIAFLRTRFDGELLYARVDLLPSPEGPVVIEVEVSEPSLFLGFAADAADRFAAAIQAWL